MRRSRPQPAAARSTNPTLAALCPWYKGHLAIGQAVGVNPESVVLSWSFSTQSINDSFQALAATVPAQPIGVQATGLTTQQANAALRARPTSTSARRRLPYYLAPAANPNDRGILTTFWLAAGPPPAPLDPTSRFITRFNPIPATRATLTIPLLVTVPNARERGRWPAARSPRPAGRSSSSSTASRGNRTDALAMADGFADACFIVAVDRPAAARHHRHGEPVLSGAERAHVQRRPDQQHDECCRVRTA